MELRDNPAFTLLAIYCAACLWLMLAMILLGVAGLSHWEDQLDFLLLTGTLAITIFLVGTAAALFSRKYLLAVLTALPMVLFVLFMIASSSGVVYSG